MSEFKDLSLFEDYMVIDIDTGIRFVQEAKLDPVIIEKKVKQVSGNVIICPEEELKGYRLEGLPENISGVFYVVSGIIKDITIYKHDADIIIQGDTDFKFGLRETDSFFKKILDLRPGDRITAVMCSNCCVDLKIGPYFGCYSWTFVNNTNPNAAKKISIKI